MTVRSATSEDLLRVVELGARFHDYSPHRVFPYEAAAFGAFAITIIESGGLFLSDTGFCGGILTPLYFAPSVLVAAELFWFTVSEGRELREAFEAWGRVNGATAVQFSAIADERADAVDRLYRCAGYRAAETSYLKELT